MIAAGCSQSVSFRLDLRLNMVRITNRSVRETAECHPNTEYGKAKLKFYNETAKLCESAGVKYREPRFFSLYGR